MNENILNRTQLASKIDDSYLEFLNKYLSSKMDGEGEVNLNILVDVMDNFTKETAMALANRNLTIIKSAVDEAMEQGTPVSDRKDKETKIVKESIEAMTHYMTEVFKQKGYAL